MLMKKLLRLLITIRVQWSFRIWILYISDLDQEEWTEVEKIMIILVKNGANVDEKTSQAPHHHTSTMVFSHLDSIYFRSGSGGMDRSGEDHDHLGQKRCEC